MYFNLNPFYTDWWQFSLRVNLLKMLDKIVLFENQAFIPKKDRFSADLLWANLRTVPTNTIFALVMTMRVQQILARAIGIQKENWG